MGFGVLLGFFDLFLRESRGTLDGDFLFLAGLLVLGGDVEDAVRIDIEGDLDLRLATAGGGNAVELEVSEQLVVDEHRALALGDADVHGGLVVGGGGENL